jgi:hypothetical protein
MQFRLSHGLPKKFQFEITKFLSLYPHATARRPTAWAPDPADGIIPQFFLDWRRIKERKGHNKMGPLNTKVFSFPLFLLLDPPEVREAPPDDACKTLVRTIL